MGDMGAHCWVEKCHGEILAEDRHELTINLILCLGIVIDDEHRSLETFYDLRIGVSDWGARAKPLIVED